MRPQFHLICYFLYNHLKLKVDTGWNIFKEKVHTMEKN